MTQNASRSTTRLAAFDKFLCDPSAAPGVLEAAAGFQQSSLEASLLRAADTVSVSLVEERFRALLTKARMKGCKRAIFPSAFYKRTAAAAGGGLKGTSAPAATGDAVTTCGVEPEPEPDDAVLKALLWQALDEIHKFPLSRTLSDNSGGAVLMHGALRKKRRSGMRAGQWNLRHFVLRERCLVYYGKAKGKLSPNATAWNQCYEPYQGMFVRPGSDHDDPYTFTLFCIDQLLELKASSEHECQRWIMCLIEWLNLAEADCQKMDVNGDADSYNIGVKQAIVNPAKSKATEMRRDCKPVSAASVMGHLSNKRISVGGGSTGPHIVMRGELLRQEGIHGFRKWGLYMFTLQRHVLSLFEVRNEEDVLEHIVLTSDWCVKATSSEEQVHEISLVKTGSRRGKARKHVLRAKDSDTCRAWAHALLDTLYHIKNIWFQEPLWQTSFSSPSTDSILTRDWESFISSTSESSASSSSKNRRTTTHAFITGTVSPSFSKQESSSDEDKDGDMFCSLPNLKGLSRGRTSPRRSSSKNISRRGSSRKPRKSVSGLFENTMLLKKRKSKQHSKAAYMSMSDATLQSKARSKSPAPFPPKKNLPAMNLIMNSVRRVARNEAANDSVVGRLLIHFDSHALKNLAMSAFSVQVQPNEIVFQVGELGSVMYIVGSGNFFISGHRGEGFEKNVPDAETFRSTVHTENPLNVTTVPERGRGASVTARNLRERQNSSDALSSDAPAISHDHFQSTSVIRARRSSSSAIVERSKPAWGELSAGDSFGKEALLHEAMVPSLAHLSILYFRMAS